MLSMAGPCERRCNTMLTCRSSCTGRRPFNSSTRSTSRSVHSRSFCPWTRKSNGFDVCVRLCVCECVWWFFRYNVCVQRCSAFSLGFQFNSRSSPPAYSPAHPLNGVSQPADMASVSAQAQATSPAQSVPLQRGIVKMVRTEDVEKDHRSYGSRRGF